MRKIDCDERIVNGRLTQIGQGFRGENKRRVAVFQCSCGEKKVAVTEKVKSGKTVSCGCYHRESISKRSARHGYTKAGGDRKEYSAWVNMIQRCCNERNERYPRYGGRGISVCERWIDSVENFISDMGECSEGMSIERINNNGNYEKDNCRWATDTEQARNRRTNRRITFSGESLCCAEWAERCGVNVDTLRDRFSAGWSVEKALTTPARKKNK